MAVFDSKKVIKQKANPQGKVISQGGDPAQYYNEKPAWTFVASDQEMWAFSQDRIGEVIWEILSKLKGFETQTWNDILVHSNTTFPTLLNYTQKTLKPRRYATLSYRGILKFYFSYSTFSPFYKALSPRHRKF